MKLLVFETPMTGVEQEFILVFTSVGTQVFLVHEAAATLHSLAVARKSDVHQQQHQITMSNDSVLIIIYHPKLISSCYQLYYYWLIAS